jgi:ADP-ribose pyrophosphatase
MSGPEYHVTRSKRHFQGSVFSVITDVVRMPDGNSAKRDYIRHRGAVAVAAVDEQGRIVLVRQYRHPVQTVLWELPAGLLDGREDHVKAAARELAEEAGCVAARWEPLVTIYSSPGYSDERVEIYLARDLSSVGPEYSYRRVAEEAQMTTHRVALAEAAAMVDRGEILNGICVTGILAAARRLGG